MSEASSMVVAGETVVEFQGSCLTESGMNLRAAIECNEVEVQ